MTAENDGQEREVRKAKALAVLATANEQIREGRLVDAAISVIAAGDFAQADWIGAIGRGLLEIARRGRGA